jgi:beta-glucanase (GH16 family)
MKNLVFTLRASLLSVLLLAAFTPTSLFSQEVAGPAPKPLVDLHSQETLKQIRQNYGDPVYTIDAQGITVQLPAARANYPGIQVFALPGTTWDLSPYGHVEAKVRNTSSALIRFSMRVDGVASGSPATNTETIAIKPGETKVLKVIFGYAWGYKQAAPLDQSRIQQVLLFLTKSTQDQSFVVEELQGAGIRGEKPPFNPDDVVFSPPNGVILGHGAAFDVARQVIPTGAKVSAGPNGTVAVNFSGHKEESVTLKPLMGVWNLNQANQIRVRFKNVGQTPVNPAVVIGPNKVAPKSPIAPGEEAEVIVSFIPAVPGLIKDNFKAGVLPGTGTKFVSNKVKSFDIVSDATPGNLLITSIVVDAMSDVLPAWLGKRPPVEGDWTMTFDDEFNAPTIDLSKWNIYGHNYWDKRTHFSKDNLILKDGNAILRYEKKSGLHNDGYGTSTDKNDAKRTDYAVGFLNTYGKFTQRYGYFESRMKLPRVGGLWPAFWLMPDRGKTGPGHYRTGTGKQPEDGNGVGGMEFDIMEFLSGWGPYRYNIAMHWDGYGKEHKSTGSENNYVRTDKDGYITCGLLWTPGSAIYYVNGREVLRWENPRVSDVQEYIMYDMVSGGWSNTPFDDTRLPDDFSIDYVRVWQRKDLASPADGPKPNRGDPSEMNN